MLSEARAAEILFALNVAEANLRSYYTLPLVELRELLAARAEVAKLQESLARSRSLIEAQAETSAQQYQRIKELEEGCRPARQMASEPSASPSTTETQRTGA